MTSENDENRAFEHEVRKTAEAIWGLPSGGCQPEHYDANEKLRELDGLSRLRDISHLIMATVSRRLDKVRDDVRKLNAAEKIERTRGVAIQKWLITRQQLEAEHVKHCRENNVIALPLSDFTRRFFDSRAYISRRRKSPFGSARNPEDDSVTLPEDEYIALPIKVIANQTGPSPRPTVWTIKDLCDHLENGETVVVLAPFGAGKSLSTREIFFALCKRHETDATHRTPLAVSLREHWGAKYADEILERHAREIGFTPREDLLVAWRSGMAVLLLDGFDEVAAQAVVSQGNKNFMRQARSQALAAARDLIKNSPRGSGCLITGRDHYFDNSHELVHALGLTQRTYVIAELGEFEEDQAEAYVRRKAGAYALPAWLPRKPLILGYLARRALLKDVLSIDANRGFSQAWTSFLKLICEREAAYGDGVMDPDTLRNLLERLAWDVRGTSSGAGPISERDLADAYLAETGQNAGEGVLMQLQRLPGLTPRDQDVGMRSFVDADLLAALQGSALARFVLENRPLGSGRPSLDALARRASETAAFIVGETGAAYEVVVSVGLRSAALKSAGSDQLSADCLAVAMAMNPNESLDCMGLVVRNAAVREISLEERQIHRLTIEDGLIEEVTIGPPVLQSSVIFKSCLIVKLAGAAEASALPGKTFQNCSIEEFDALSTNAAIVGSDLSPGTKALLTVLRKLYLQAGGGRQVSALKRGLPSGAILDSVDGVIRILEANNMISLYGGVAHPIRRHTGRVRAILAAPLLSGDPIVGLISGI